MYGVATGWNGWNKRKEEMMHENTINEIRRSLEKHGYFLVRLLGRGNFSEVYLVKNRSGELYACKVSKSPELLQKEAEIMEKLEHPLLPQFTEFCQEEAGYLVMEYVAGSTLEEMICRRGGFSPERVAEVGIELASGLACLHKQAGMVFRDVKPANIILCQNGRIKLIDFGCVCTLGEKAKSRAGTPGFAAPEQMQAGKELTAACDVYGLGKTLESMLGKNEKNKKLNKIISVCTEEAEEKRFPDMDCVIRALANYRSRSKNRRKSTGTDRGRNSRGYIWTDRRKNIREYIGADEGSNSRKYIGEVREERGYETAILSGKMQIRKNIWKSLYKNT